MDGKDNKRTIVSIAAEALKDNALQTTYVPREKCPDGEYLSRGDCAHCGFKCAKALSGASGLSPIEERGSIDPDAVPVPETTFPLPQIIIALAGFVAGCLLSQVFLKLF